MEEIRSALRSLSEPSYQQFHAGLLPGVESILGVRVPKLRILAKEIASKDWRAFLHEDDLKYYEEYMLQGMVVGYAAMDLTERLAAMTSFIPKINNWAVCDSFCSGLKFIKTEQAAVWNFIQPYFAAAAEYQIRFAVVTALDFFIEPLYIKRLFPIFDRIHHDGYYVKMAVAWAISVCYVKYPALTWPYLQQNALDDFTHNKALQKIIESFRVSDTAKAQMRTIKRRTELRSMRS